MMTLISSASAMIVGHDDSRGVDDKPGTERVGLVRLHIAAPRTARTTAVLEEVVEEFLERRARRQLRRRAPALTAGAALGFDGLRGRDIDHRVDHFLGNVGDTVRTARQRGRRGQETCRAKACAEADRGHQRAQATAQGWGRNGHISALFSKMNGI
jgi:hypothetical protein